MNDNQLFALYDRVADVPGAVGRLRRFVLDLAVRGKLVKQDPADEPANELLKRITDEAERHSEVGKHRRSKVSRLQMASPPFELPHTWCWASLGTVFQYDAGMKCDPKHLDPSAWLLELQDVEKGTGRLLNRVRTGDREPKSSKSEFSLGDILYGKLRPYLNKVLVADRGGYSTTEIVAIRPYLRLSSEYCALALRRPDFVQYVTRLGQGTKMPRLRTKDAVVAPFPLPPLAEQHRIVAKVNELMALCDQLEGVRGAREETRDNLTKASLIRLSAPDPDKPTFHAHVSFAVDALPSLTARVDQIKQLRQVIFNLAVHGKLVEQDPTDEPASELLKRTDEEKARLTAARAIRKPGTVTSLDSDSYPFPIPCNWKWTQIAKLGIINPRNEAPDDHLASFIPMSLIATEYGKSVQHESRRWGKIKRGYTHFAEGDVGLAKITPCFENGKSTVFRNLTGGIGSGTTELHIVRPLHALAEYIVLFLKSPVFIKTGTPKMTGTAGQKRVSSSYFTSSPFPLPPLAEQHRIVAKVGELMVLCDQLESGVVSTNKLRDRLLESFHYGALAFTAHESADTSRLDE